MKDTYCIFALALIIVLQSCFKNDELEPVNNNEPANLDTVESEKRNVILIVIDDLGWKDLGIYGSCFYKTQNIDDFAMQSALFTNAYSPSPVCSPSRAAILTGLHPNKTGVTNFINSGVQNNAASHDFLRLEFETIGEKLREKSYATYYVGKWHLGGEGFLPTEQGFDVNIGGSDKGEPESYYSPFGLDNMESNSDEYLSDRLTDEAIKLVKQKIDDPFFLMMSYYAVHTPIQGYAEYKDQFDNHLEPQYIEEGQGKTLTNQGDPEYASMLKRIDYNVGRLMDSLDNNGLLNNSLIIITSDNGGYSTVAQDQNAATSVLPLRGGKGWLFEGGIRVPLIIRAPELPAGIYDSPSIGMDLLPTILDFVGLKYNTSDYDGKSLLDVANDDFEDRILFWHFPHRNWAAPKSSAIRAGEWKLINIHSTKKYKLYNLKDNDSESEDLSSQNSVILDSLIKEMNKKHIEYQSIFKD